jgi:PhzF family phenazine biosynthesis protein
MKEVLSIAARAFAHKNSGGNPVTVFFLPDSKQKPAESIRSSLARTCAWESVMVHFATDGESIDDESDDISSPPPRPIPTPTPSPTPTLFFYMPSGEEVSYCAHAAMGASYALTKQPKWQKAALAAVLESEYESESDLDHVNFVTAGGVENTALIQDTNVEIGMTNDLQEMELRGEQRNTTIASLLNQIGLNMNDVMPENDSSRGTTLPLPFLNASVARYKTLVPIKSLGRLHMATNPREKDEFRMLCDSIGSTGLYLYKNVPSREMKMTNVYECRQFPRASGYPEDPATGIAAAALASSLQRGGILGDNDKFVMYQGTAMGKKSSLNVRINDDTVYCSGTVEIDNEEYISVDDLY